MATNPYGFLAHHISTVFGRSSIWSDISDNQQDVIDHLRAWDLDKQSDFYRIPMSSVPKDDRAAMLEERTRLLGFDRIFQDPNLNMEDPNGVFRIRKLASETERGYGSFVLHRSHFIRTLKDQGLSTQEKIDDIAAKLHYIMPTFQIDEAEPLISRYSLSGTIYSEDFVRNIATQVANIEKMADPNAVRLVFDVESAGLRKEDRIWQLSARLMQGDKEILDAAGNARSVNLHFRNSMMEAGAYGDGRMTWEAFYESMRGDAVQWEDDFSEGIKKFLHLAQDADFLVGQNTAFDVGMIEYGIKTYKNRYKTDLGFQQLADTFLEKAHSEKLVDTRVLSMMLLGDDITIAEELSKMGKYTPYSMENILLQTSFLSDLEARLGASYADEFVTSASLAEAGGHGGRAAIRARLGASGGDGSLLHLGDVDTWFEGHLQQVQIDALQGKTGEGGSKLLSAIPLADDDILRPLIESSSAITPFTKVAALGGMTPMEYMSKHYRDTMLRMPGSTNANISQLYNAGIYRSVTDQVLTDAGTLRQGIPLNNLPGFDVAQQKAVAAGLPFAFLSPFERTAATLFSVAGKSPLDNEARNILGDIIGSATIQRTKQAKVMRGTTNVALPMELLIEAELEGVFGGRTNFAGALSDRGPEALQTARWSALDYKDNLGRIHKDVALVADIFQTKEEITDFLKWLDDADPALLEEMGITPSVLKDIKQALPRHGIRYGVQIGILGKGTATDRVFNFLQQFTLGVDSQNMTLRSALFGRTEDMGRAATDDVFFASSPYLDIGDNKVDELLAHTQLESSLFTRGYGEAVQNPHLLRSIKWGRRNPARAQKINNALEAVWSPTGKKTMLGAGASLAGYYLYRRHREQSAYDATTDDQEYEQEGYYEDYKQQLGERVPPNYEQLHHQRLDSLSTAGLVNQLDMNKTRHHMMGPGKYNHLYGG